MKVKAKVDLNYHGKNYKAGHQFEALADDAQDMLLDGQIEGDGLPLAQPNNPKVPTGTAPAQTGAMSAAD